MSQGNVHERRANSRSANHDSGCTHCREATTEFAYNGDGARVGKTVGAATTDYLVDLAATLPVVISDTDAVYLYGLDIIAEQLAGADRYYYVHDGLGSVRQVLDNTGQIEAKYTYDPFGVPLSGDAVPMPNPWQFTGEAWDAGVELLYLRARYYQPATGRFVTKDPWRGAVSDPATIQGYLYVGNNPVSYTDPSGLFGPGAFPKPPLPDPDYVREVARTFDIPPELLGAVLQTVVEIDYNFDDFLADFGVQFLLINRVWGPPDIQLLAELALNALPESLSLGLAQMQYGTAREVEEWLAQRMADDPADCEYVEMRRRLPTTENRTQLSFQLLRRDEAVVYAAAYLRRIIDYRIGVETARISDEEMALAAALYNAGLYNFDVTHFSHHKFGNYIMDNDLLAAWRTRIGAPPPTPHRPRRR